MTITLSDPLASRVQQAAAQRGEAPSDYALAALAGIIEQDISAQNGAGDPDAALTDEERASVRAGIKRGLTDFTEGWLSSASDFYAKMQAQHGLFTPRA